MYELGRNNEVACLNIAKSDTPRPFIRIAKYDNGHCVSIDYTREEAEQLHKDLSKVLAINSPQEK